MSMGSNAAISPKRNSNILKTAVSGARSMTNIVSTALKKVRDDLPTTDEAVTYAQLATAVAKTKLPTPLKAAFADLAKNDAVAKMDQETYNKFAFNLPGSSGLT